MADDRGGRRRYRLLETLRAFAVLRLREHHGTADVQRRHLGHFRTWLHAANQRIRSADEVDAHRAIAQDWHNLRTAVSNACALDDGIAGCELIRRRPALGRDPDPHRSR